jgi:hypothetical protein
MEGNELEAEQPSAEVEGGAEGDGSQETAEQQGAAAGAQDQAAAAQAAVDQAKQRKGESTDEFEVRLSKMKGEARRARVEAERFRAENGTMKQRIEAAEAELEKARGRKGISRQRFVQLSQAVLEAGEDAAKREALFDADELEVSPALQARIDKLEKQLDQRAQREQQSNYAQSRQKEEGIVSGIMKELVDNDECPLFEAFPGYAGQVLDEWYGEWKANGGTPETRPDPYEVAQRVHKAVAADLLTALQSERARSFLFRSKPELKALLGGHETSAGGPTRDAQGAGLGNGPKAKTTSPTVQRPPSASVTKHRLLDEEDELEASRAEYRKYQLELQQQNARR